MIGDSCSMVSLLLVQVYKDFTFSPWIFSQSLCYQMCKEHYAGYCILVDVIWHPCRFILCYIKALWHSHTGATGCRRVATITKYLKIAGDFGPSTVNLRQLCGVLQQHPGQSWWILHENNRGQV
jgi:hypothetical protein